MIVGSFMAFADLIVPLPENHPKQTLDSLRPGM